MNPYKSIWIHTNPYESIYCWLFPPDLLAIHPSITAPQPAASKLDASSIVFVNGTRNMTRLVVESKGSCWEETMFLRQILYGDIIGHWYIHIIYISNNITSGNQPWQLKMDEHGPFIGVFWARDIHFFRRFQLLRLITRGYIHSHVIHVMLIFFHYLRQSLFFCSHFSVWVCFLRRGAPNGKTMGNLMITVKMMYLARRIWGTLL